MTIVMQMVEDIPVRARAKWSKSIEFLLSCIAMSVGLGNIWRFPYTAYNNGGGAFLIPYILVLFLVAKPIYFMEMVLGQFSSKGCVKVYDFVPALRGIGVGQTLSVSYVMTYYSALMAMIVYYIYASFTTAWSKCDPSWINCISSEYTENISEPRLLFNETVASKSSPEQFFINTVLKQVPNIDNGIGVPDLKLSLCLALAWITIFFVVLRGVKSTGKAAYFLAIFPYLIIVILLVKAVTLPGSLKGIEFFLKPDFGALLKAKVWYEAVGQCFFSLSVCFGVVIMYSSYNDFHHNMYRDAIIVTTIDMITSMFAGVTIFGILGNLAHVKQQSLTEVVQVGWNLAFVTYPDAISKFEIHTAIIFGILFFSMMFVLSVGSICAMVSCSVTVIKDKFPSVKRWQAVTCVTICGFLASLIYLTPGGMYILNLVDERGAKFVVYILGIGQIIGVSWIYGVRRFCNDIEFMLNMKVSVYWRICWSIVTPAILIVILIYSLVKIAIDPFTYNNVSYPTSAIVCGWILSAFGISLVPAFAIFSFYKRRHLGFPEMILSAFRPREEWGPVDLAIKIDWLNFNQKKDAESASKQRSKYQKIFDKVLGY